eukprot:CAMPEP_0168357098 /NCGR_PEP_ID=MMETSP0228-20121227/409_1 /TAXON_ID=133427 /ORGANISM="Protoceratium reticulatum, Strain CCCM 535 (=CCMP 1889)" /LENGTH=36 /DNA_ID= /DNA_START= /DNA_END= /DNA_ORIENTATION=
MSCQRECSGKRMQTASYCRSYPAMASVKACAGGEAK